MRLAALLCSLPLWAQQPGSIDGRVIEEVTGKPVKGARIQVFGAAGPIRPAISDASGNFSIPAVSPGHLRLRVDHARYPDLRGHLAQRTTPVELGPGQNLRGVTLHLTPPAAVTGRIVDEDGDPMMHCHVAVHHTQWTNGRQRLAPVGSASTDDRGEYRIFGVPAGTYYLYANCQRQPRSPRPFGPVAPGADLPQETYPPLFYPRSTLFSGASAIVIEPGVEREGLDFRVERARAAYLRVEVAGDRRLASSVNVQLERKGSPVPAMPARMVRRSPQSPVEVFVLVPGPGSYVLRGMAFSESSIAAGSEEVEIGARPVEQVTLRLAESVDLSATVEFEDGADAGGVASLEFFPIEAGDSGAHPHVQKQPDGTFAVARLLPGAWQVRVHGSRTGFVRSVRVGERFHPSDRIEIAPGESGPIHVLLSRRTGLVEAQAPAATFSGAGPAIAFLIGEGDRRFDYRSRRQFGAVNGRFEMGDIAPGRYRLFAFESHPGSLLEDPRFLDAIESRGERVTVEENSRLTAQPGLISAALMEAIRRECCR